MKHQLAGLIGERQRQIIHAVVDEIYSNPGEEYALKLMPIRNVPAAVLINERLSGMGGLTGERNYGEPGKSINNGSSKTSYFEPGSYQEHSLFTEKDLLKLRKYGTLGERGVTGLTSGELDELSRAGMKLQLRIKNRINKLIWDAFFTGQYVWKAQTFDFAIPGANALTSASDWTISSTSTPFSDLWAIQTQNSSIIKYVVKEYVMNPKQLSLMLQSQEVTKVIQNNNIQSRDINVISQFLYPGLAPIKVVKDHFQDETLNADGSINLGAASFFVPDNKVLIVPDFGGLIYGAFGEFDIAENMNDPSATLDKPAVGIYTFVDEFGLEKRENPHVKVVSGFNGAPNLLRMNDVYTIATH